MKRAFLLIVCLFLAITSLCGCGGSKDEAVKLTVSEVAHSVFYAPQYAAMSLGFFAEEGLEIELVNGQGADKVMTAVVSGQAQIGLAGPEAAIYVYNEGKEDYCEVFAQLTKRDGSFLIGREKADNFSYDMLNGAHIIGGRKGGVPCMTLEYVLKNKGVDMASVNLDTSIQFAMMAGAFTSGNGDYVTLFEPTASIVEKEGRGHILASIGQDSGEIPYTAYFANKSYIENNPDVIERFTRAIYKGQQWIKTAAPEEVAKLMVDYFPDTDLDILASVARRYAEIDAWNSTPFMTKDAFDRLQDVMSEAGELNQRAPYEKLVNNAFAEKVAK